MEKDVWILINWKNPTSEVRSGDSPTKKHRTLDRSEAAGESKASEQEPPLLRTVTATATKPSTAYRTENRESFQGGPHGQGWGSQCPDREIKQSEL